MTKEFDSWSVDGEYYQYDSLAELLQSEGEDLAPGNTVYAGIGAQPIPSDFFCIDDLIEQAAERAYDTVGEVAAGWPDVDNAARTELEGLLSDWFNRHCPIWFWAVEGAKPYVLTAQDFIDAGVDCPASGEGGGV